MIAADYSQSIIRVKSQSSLTEHSLGSNLPYMEFSERLKQARGHAQLTQEGLATKSGVKQGTISKIERGDTDSSTFTVQLAKACGVRPEWLAMEDGEMVDGLYVDDERIKRCVAILEQLKAEFRLDDALELLNSVVKFSQKKSGQ
jgi:transcriptional regulator with XRE-family HTH domain